VEVPFSITMQDSSVRIYLLEIAVIGGWLTICFVVALGLVIYHSLTSRTYRRLVDEAEL